MEYYGFIWRPTDHPNLESKPSMNLAWNWILKRKHAAGIPSRDVFSLHQNRATSYRHGKASWIPTLE